MVNQLTDVSTVSFKRAVLGTVGAAALSLAMPLCAAQAQESGDSVGAQDDSGLDTIYVTARKRRESLQEVPQSVSAISGEALQRTRADNLQDLEGLAPNVVIDTYNSFPNAASVSIRGISHTEIEKSFDPAIGIIVDGVFLGTNSQALVDNFDLERVEILRGPQGTLFGRNTIGGLINVTRKRPEHEFSGKVSYGYSSFDRHDARAIVNLPLAEDTLAARFAVSYANSDGHQTNTFNSEKLAGVDMLNMRGALLFEPSQDLSFYLNVDHVRDRGDLFGLRNANQPAQFFSFPMFGGFAPTFPGYPADTGPYDEVRSDLTGNSEYDTTTASLQADWELSDITLTSISAYIMTDEDVISDFDAEASAGFNSRRVQDYDQFTQELRLSYDAGGRINFVLGAYYFWSDYELDQTIDVLTDFLPCGALPVPFATLGCTQNGGASQKTNSYALFGQANINITDRLRLTAGGRYTIDDKSFTSMPITFPVGGLGSAADSEDWSRFTPRIGLDYKVSGDVMIYVLYSNGYKSGGYNGRAGSLTSIGPYDPEIVDSFEGGFKSEWADRRVRLNGAVFYNDYSDMQVELIRSAPGGGGQETVVENAAAAETYGVELEMFFQPVPALTFDATLGYLEASYQEFVADIGFGAVTDNSDLELRKAPKWQYSIGASVTQPAGDLGELRGNVRWRWSDAMETTTQNFSFGRRRSAGNLDASIGLYASEDRWWVVGYARNLTDERYIIDGLSAGALLSFTSVNLPRTLGFEIGASF